MKLRIPSTLFFIAAILLDRVVISSSQISLNQSLRSSSISPVNTFRVIFNTYFGTDLPLLEDRSYMTFCQHPDRQADITMERDSLNGYTISDFQTQED